LPSQWKSRRDFPAGFHLEEEMPNTHLNFLALTLVIVIIKVKIIIKKRQGLGPVQIVGPAHPG
jgi:hypothetical protein